MLREQGGLCLLSWWVPWLAQRVAVQVGTMPQLEPGVDLGPSMASLVMLRVGWSSAELLLCSSCPGSASVGFYPQPGFTPYQSF